MGSSPLTAVEGGASLTGVTGRKELVPCLLACIRVRMERGLLSASGGKMVFEAFYDLSLSRRNTFE